MFVVNSVDLLLSSFVYMRDVCIGLIYLIGWLRSGVGCYYMAFIG